MATTAPRFHSWRFGGQQGGEASTLALSLCPPATIKKLAYFFFGFVGTPRLLQWRRTPCLLSLLSPRKGVLLLVLIACCAPCPTLLA